MESEIVSDGSGRPRKLSGDQITLPTTVDYSVPKQIVLKKREPLNFTLPDGNTGFSSRLAVKQDIPLNAPSTELGDLDNWQENSNAWEDESNATWEAEDVLRQQKMAEREKRALEQQRKKIEKEAQRLTKKEQKIAVTMCWERE
ncbi:UNVERIFIED_CONTAM: hypothetical protein FKN15_059447 [Acipenser sinensis]